MSHHHLIQGALYKMHFKGIPTHGKKIVQQRLFDNTDDSNDQDNRPLKRGTWQRHHRLHGKALKVDLFDGTDDSKDPNYICGEDSDIQFDIIGGTELSPHEIAEAKQRARFKHDLYDY